MIGFAFELDDRLGEIALKSSYNPATTKPGTTAKTGPHFSIPKQPQ
jgi:hypothetical protein